MSTVAVIAHSGKSLEGGLPALRKALERNGISDPLWHEVAKSRQAPEQVRSALKQGADLIFVWGGDGMVQRCVDVVAGSKATMAILRRALRICSHRTSGYRAHRRRGRCRAQRHPSQAGRRPNER